MSVETQYASGGKVVERRRSTCTALPQRICFGELICNSPGILDSNSRGDFHHRRVLGTLILKLTMSPARDRCAMNFFRACRVYRHARSCMPESVEIVPVSHRSAHLNTELIETVARKIAFLPLISRFY